MSFHRLTFLFNCLYIIIALLWNFFNLSRPVDGGRHPEASRTQETGIQSLFVSTFGEYVYSNWLKLLILSVSYRFGLPQYLWNVHQIPKYMNISTLHPHCYRSWKWSPPYHLSSHKVLKPAATRHLTLVSACGWEADLCSPWHPDCPLAARVGVLLLRSCGASCPRSVAGPSADCWTRHRTDSSTSLPLSRHSRWPPPWARAGQGKEGGM